MFAIFAITTTWKGHRNYTSAKRYLSTETAREIIARQRETQSVTIDGGTFVPRDMDIELTPLSNGAAMLRSAAMNCEFPVARRGLKKRLEALITEYNDRCEGDEWDSESAHLEELNRGYAQDRI